MERRNKKRKERNGWDRWRVYGMRFLEMEGARQESRKLEERGNAVRRNNNRSDNHTNIKVHKETIYMMRLRYEEERMKEGNLRENGVYKKNGVERI